MARRITSLSWSKLRSAFSVVLASWRGEKVDRVALLKAHRRIQKRARATAIQLLRRWYIRNPEIEADDVVQQWNVELYSRAFERCNDERMVGRYCYRILRRRCSAVVRRESRSRIDFDLTAEPEDGRCSWLDSMEHTEQLIALERAISLLPPKWCAAVKKWLASRAVGQRISFATECDRRQFHNVMFRARHRLMALLSEQRSKMHETPDVNRAA